MSCRSTAISLCPSFSLLSIIEYFPRSRVDHVAARQSPLGIEKCLSRLYSLFRARTYIFVFA